MKRALSPLSPKSDSAPPIRGVRIENPVICNVSNFDGLGPLRSNNLSIKADGLSVSQFVVPLADDRLTDTSVGKAQRHAAIAAAIPAELCKKLNEVPSAALIDRIDVKLDGAPPEKLKERIWARWKTIMSLGLLENLAEDVGKAWKIEGPDSRERASAAGASPNPFDQFKDEVFDEEE